MVINCLNFGETIFDVFFIKKLLLGGSLAYFYKIKKNIVIDALRGVCHINSSLEICLFRKIRETCAVIDVKMSHQQEFDLFWVYDVEIGERLYSLAARMHSAVQHDLSAFAL